MPARPRLVAFDIIETFFSLEPLRDTFVETGLPGDALELWFGIALRDAFALAVTGEYLPFQQVQLASFAELFAVHRRNVDKAMIAKVMAKAEALPPQPGAEETLRMLKDAGIRIAALTNGSVRSTETLLAGAGLSSWFEKIVSTDEVKLSKPRAEVYSHLLDAVGTRSAETALVACHGWDIHGAAKVGLTTAYVEHRKPFPKDMTAPDVSGPSLPETVRALIALPAAT